ncbi:histone H1-like [Phyllopteryx taeniolatus]|uniref:histone H1-like n=1 Tax=Phyllopteryx taeniolatus TaxID=161469 RepID=UPI002AD2C79B|nr:histone H1-like [Phyllopteryx taeniolatus]
MAEVAPAQAAPAKSSTKKKPSSGTKAAGPSASELILQAVAASNDRNGVSLVALKKYLAGKGYDVEKNRARLKAVIKGMVVKGAIVQIKGTGASGSFKMSKKNEDNKPKAPAKADKSSNKDKKVATQKVMTSKKPAAKKATKKSPKTATPKKVKKPAKASKKSPAAKKVAKPRTVKRAAAPKKK